MTVKFSAEVEKEEIERRDKPDDKPKWELYRSASLVLVVHWARANGWADNKVQVKRDIIAKNMVDYVVEPYEEGCRCHNLLSYDDFFLREDLI
jgi:hypothetical protein